MVAYGAEELEELEEMVLSENAFGDLCREEDEKTKVARGVDDDDDDDDDEDTNNKIVDQYVAQFERIQEVNLCDAYGQPFTHLVPSFVKTSRVKTGTQLTLVFQLPSKINRNYLSKSVNFIETLLGHLRQWSFRVCYAKRGLCSELCAGVSRGGLDDTSISALLSVSIKLTERGATRMEDILFHPLYVFAKLKRFCLPTVLDFTRKCNKFHKLNLNIQKPNTRASLSKD